MTALCLDRPAGACRLCGATVGQRSIGRERRLDLGQWLMRCCHCGGGYLDPAMTESAETAFYAGGAYRRAYPVECARSPEEVIAGQRLRETADWRVGRLLLRLAPGARVLEVGSGYGAFLGRLHARRPDLILSAIEPDRAVRTAGLDGAPVAFFDRIDDTQGLFDVIVLYHVLEHLRDPATTLTALAARLAPGGRVVAEVPDESGPWPGWSQVHAAHLNYFSMASLRRLFGCAGLVEIVSPSPPLPGTLHIEAVPGVAILSEASPDEIAARDATFTAHPWRRRDALKRSLRRWAIRIIGPETVGRWQRRRAARAADRMLAAAGSAPRRWLLGVPIDPLPMDVVVAKALAAMRERRPLRQADVNVAKLVEMQRDARLLADTISSDVVCADGMGVVWGARLLGVDVPERVTGIDLMERLLMACAAEGLRPFLLGTEAAILDQTVARLKARHPGLTLAGSHHGFFSAADEATVVAQIRQTQADCLFVAMGSPRQERFLAEHHAALGVPFVMAVGGAFDVLAGLRRRAPRWMQRCGLEWFARLIQEPRRLGPRYLFTNLHFGGLLLRALFRPRMMK